MCLGGQLGGSVTLGAGVVVNAAARWGAIGEVNLAHVVHAGDSGGAVPVPEGLAVGQSAARKLINRKQGQERERCKPAATIEIGWAERPYSEGAISSGARVLAAAQRIEGSRVRVAVSAHGACSAGGRAAGVGRVGSCDTPGRSERICLHIRAVADRHSARINRARAVRLRAAEGASRLRTVGAGASVADGIGTGRAAALAVSNSLAAALGGPGVVVAIGVLANCFEAGIDWGGTVVADSTTAGSWSVCACS